MAIDDVGAKRLLATVLKQAYNDYTKAPKNCLPTCEFYNTCTSGHNPVFCDAKNFLHSAWCASMCDGLDVDHPKMVAKAVDTRMSREMFCYIEAELRGFKATLKEVEQLRRDIINDAPVFDDSGIRGTGLSNPTAAKATRLMTDRRLKRLESLVEAIQGVYNSCSQDKQRLIKLKYWDKKLTDEGITNDLCIEARTLRRWKKAIITAIAIELGYI